MFDVVVIGSANLDLVARAPRIPSPGETLLGSGFDEFPGGKGLNQAVAAARAGASTAFVSAVGGDDAGDALLDVATDAGVDVERVVRHQDRPTGRALIIVDDRGENSIVVIPGANARVIGSAVPPARVVLSQLEVPLEAIAEALHLGRRAGATTVLDPAPAAPLPSEVLAATDIVVPNEHEVELIGGVDALLAAGVGTVLVTRGASGVTIHDASGSRALVADAVDTIDTTAAGDAFCGALASELARGRLLDDAVRWASAAGALATTRRGAVPSLPRRSEVDQLIADRSSG